MGGIGLSFSLFQRIRRHAAISSGNFEVLFKDISIAPLPVATVRLIEELDKPEASLERISGLIGSMPAISAQVLKMVNSSLFSLRSPVLSIQHAVTLLGLDHIRAVALSFLAVKAVPRPNERLFDHQAFWTDSLLRALVARGLAKRTCPEQCDDAFTAMLLADVALPVLLGSWSEYYLPVIEQWRHGSVRLSEIEKKQFGWTHAQAGAWILQYWKFPEQLICYVGIHNGDPSLIEKLQLENTIALPLMTASLLPSCLHPKGGRADAFLRLAVDSFELDFEELSLLLDEVEEGFLDICDLMALCHMGELPTLGEVRAAMSETLLSE